MNPQELTKFAELLHNFALVERIAHVKGRDVRQNDAEHSYFLPMLAWYLIDALKLPLQLDRVLQYALVHDLVEVYAGDTYIFDEEARKTKDAREEKSRLRIAEEFPEFGSLHETILAYEKQEDEESRFVKQLDKLEPLIGNYLQEGRTWKEMNVSFFEIAENKRKNIHSAKEIRDLLEKFLSEMEARKSDFFLR